MNNNISDYSTMDLESRFKEALSKPYEEWFCEKFNIERMDRSGGITRLLGNEYKDKIIIIPGSDHVVLFGRNGIPLIYAFQPYGMAMFQFKGLIELCEKYGLEFELLMRGFYYPGVASLVIIYRPPFNTLKSR